MDDEDPELALFLRKKKQKEMKAKAKAKAAEAQQSSSKETEVDKVAASPPAAPVLSEMAPIPSGGGVVESQDTITADQSGPEDIVRAAERLALENFVIELLKSGRISEAEVKKELSEVPVSMVEGQTTGKDKVEIKREAIAASVAEAKRNQIIAALAVARAQQENTQKRPSRKVNQKDLFSGEKEDDVAGKWHRENVDISSYRKQMEFGAKKYIKP